MNSDSPIGDGMMASMAVDRFFRRVLADPALTPHFETAELHRLAAQQRAFLIAHLGDAYLRGAGAPPVTAGPGTEQAMTEHLAAALRDVGVPADMIDTITAAAQRPAPVAAGYPGASAHAPAQLPRVPTLPQAPTLAQAPTPLPQVPVREHVRA